MEEHTPQEAEALLRDFLQGRELSFSITSHEDDQWIATCDEIPAITTCGKGDYTERDTLVRDAIISAAGIRGDYGYLLKFKGFKLPPSFMGLTKKAEADKPYYVVQS